MGRDVFIALAAVGWADGKLDAEEADAIVRTAVEEGLDIEEIAEIEAATKAPVGVERIDRSSLTERDRLFVYAVACWLTRLDGRVDAGEVEALRTLGGVLDLPERARARASILAKEIAELPEGDRPARFDLTALRNALSDLLASGA